uniref:FH2 domain-containing protein n=1 Tax=Echinostoma caproni TaxID=27848 RepID=A0A183A325_9TREM
LNRSDVRALLDASKKDDFEQFVQCLEDVRCASPNCSKSKQKAFGTDLQNYALYFDHVLAEETNRTDLLEDPVHQHGLTTKSNGHHTSLSNGHGCQPNSRPDHTRTETSCTETSSCIFTPPPTPQTGLLVTTDMDPGLQSDQSIKHQLTRSVSHEPTASTLPVSSSTKYLGTLARRHSTQEFLSIKPTEEVEHTVGSFTKPGSEYLNPINIPNLGKCTQR